MELENAYSQVSIIIINEDELYVSVTLIMLGYLLGSSFSRLLFKYAFILTSQVFYSFIDVSSANEDCNQQKQWILIFMLFL